MQDAESGVPPELGEISLLQNYSGYRQQFVSTSSAAGALGSREKDIQVTHSYMLGKVYYKAKSRLESKGSVLFIKSSVSRSQ